MVKIYKRICKNCKKELIYKYYQSWYRAEKDNALCRKCTGKKRRLNNSKIEEIKEYYRLGLTNRQIAKKMNITHGTIAYYLQSLNLISNWDKRYPPIDKVDENNARCVKCKQIKSLKEFQFGRKGQKYEYKLSYCNECRKKQSYLNINKNIETFLKDKYHKLIRRCNYFNIFCDLSFEDFIYQYNTQKGKCFYTDVLLIWGVGKGFNGNSLSIDKIIPEKGYTKNNFVFCAYRVNTAKYNFSLEEMKKWMPLWYEKISKFLSDGDF